MYVVAQLAPKQNTYFAPPPSRGLGDPQPIDATSILSQVFTQGNLLMIAGTVIAGIVALHFIGGSSPRPRRKKRQPTYVQKSHAVLGSMVAIALVGGIAYTVGNKTA